MKCGQERGAHWHFSLSGLHCKNLRQNNKQLKYQNIIKTIRKCRKSILKLNIKGKNKKRFQIVI